MLFMFFLNAFFCTTKQFFVQCIMKENNPAQTWITHTSVSSIFAVKTNDMYRYLIILVTILK